MELFDVLDENGNKKGYTHPRCQPMRHGDYHLVVEVMVKNKENKLLLMYRDPKKPNGDSWEISGGAAQAGEDSLTAIQRELSEETGIFLPKESFRFLSRTKRGFRFFDLYSAECDVPIEKITFQENETTDARYVTKEEFKALCDENKICRPIKEVRCNDILSFFEEKINVYEDCCS